MYLNVAMTLCCVGIGITVLSSVLVIGVAKAYHPDAEVGLLIIPVVLSVGICTLVIIARERRGPLRLKIALPVGVIGAGLAAGGLVMSAADPGDTFLYIGPVLMGAGFLILALEPEEEQG